MKTSWYGCLGSSSRVCLRAKALNKHQLWPGSIRRYASYRERRISVRFYPGQECNVFIMLYFPCSKELPRVVFYLFIYFKKMVDFNSAIPMTISECYWCKQRDCKII